MEDWLVSDFDWDPRALTTGELTFCVQQPGLSCSEGVLASSQASGGTACREVLTGVAGWEYSGRLPVRLGWGTCWAAPPWAAPWAVTLAS